MRGFRRCDWNTETPEPPHPNPLPFGEREFACARFNAESYNHSGLMFAARMTLPQLTISLLIRASNSSGVLPTRS